jgi:hypothetical protein
MWISFTFDSRRYCVRRTGCFLLMAHRHDPGEDLEVYAVAAGSLPARIRVAGRTLRVFRVESIAVIAGPPLEVPVEEALREQHSLIVALAERVDPILPVRFGARMAVARIPGAIGPSVDVLTRALVHVRGRQQMTMRMAGPAIADYQPAASGMEYLAQRRAAQALPPAASPLREAVAPFVVDERIRRGHGSIRLTVFHLVKRNDVCSYTEAARAAAGRISPWSISLSGPWPPFAFAPELSR